MGGAVARETDEEVIPRLEEGNPEASGGKAVVVVVVGVAGIAVAGGVKSMEVGIAETLEVG